MPPGSVSPSRARPTHRPTRSAPAPAASGIKRSWRHFSGDAAARIGPPGSGGAADADAPDIGALVEIVPREGAFVLGLELIIERLRIVIVDEDEILPRLEFVERVEDQGVPFARDDRTDIDDRAGRVLYGVHSLPPLCTAGRLFGPWAALAYPPTACRAAVAIPRSSVRGTTVDPRPVRRARRACRGSDRAAPALFPRSSSHRADRQAWSSSALYRFHSRRARCDKRAPDRRY